MLEEEVFEEEEEEEEEEEDKLGEFITERVVPLRTRRILRGFDSVSSEGSLGVEAMLREGERRGEKEGVVMGGEREGGCDGEDAEREVEEGGGGRVESGGREEVIVEGEEEEELCFVFEFDVCAAFVSAIRRNNSLCFFILSPFPPATASVVNGAVLSQSRPNNSAVFRRTFVHSSSSRTMS